MAYRRTCIALSLCAASAVAMLVSACEGGGSSDDAGVDATSTETGTDAASTEAGSDAASTDAAPDSPCGAGLACQGCCVGLFRDAAAAFTGYERTCACTNPGDCQTICNSTLCSGKAANNVCSQCLRSPDAGACSKNAVTTCKADPSCTPLLNCFDQCVVPIDAGGD